MFARCTIIGKYWALDPCGVFVDYEGTFIGELLVSLENYYFFGSATDRFGESIIMGRINDWQKLFFYKVYEEYWFYYVLCQSAESSGDNHWQGNFSDRRIFGDRGKASIILILREVLCPPDAENYLLGQFRRKLPLSNDLLKGGFPDDLPEDKLHRNVPKKHVI